MNKLLFYILSACFLITSLFSCIDDPSISSGVKGAGVPVFEEGATTLSGKTANSVTISTTITMENGSKITSRGFYYGTISPPSLENGGIEVKDQGVGIGSYTIIIGDLANYTKYYFLPFAENEIGFGYGEIITDETNSGYGDVRIINLYDEHASSFKIGTEIIYEGEGDRDNVVTGIYCYTNKDSVAIDTIVDAIYSEDNKYTYQLTGLYPSTKYYVKAFIKNDYGEYIGLADSITTRDGMFDVGETTLLSSGYTDAKFSSSVNNGDDSTVSIEERGFCWSKTPNSNPTLSDSVLKCGNDVGTFEGTINNLETQENYYIRAYAINNFGMTIYGEVKLFSTLQDVPSVETERIDETKILNGSAEIKGLITDKGMSEIVYSGICWSTTNPYPTEVTDNYRHVSAGVGVVFSIQLTELKGGVRYYVRAYAKNNSGTSYGEVKEFLTPSIFDTSLKPLQGAKRLSNSAAYFVINGNLCLLGGDLGTDFTNEFLMYNISSNEWSLRMPFNGGKVKWQSGVGYGSGAYVYGGYDGSGDEKAGFYHYNYSNNQWLYMNGPDFDSITVRRTLGYANSNGVFYIGGISGDTVRSDVWCFIAQSFWEKKTDFPVEQYGGVAVVIDNVAYVGMGKNSYNVCNGKLWTTVDGAVSWNFKTECTIFNGGILAGVVCNKRLYVIDESYQILEFDPITDIWKIKSQLPASHREYFNCMYSVNNKIYIGLGTTNSLIEYDPLWDN